MKVSTKRKIKKIDKLDLVIRRLDKIENILSLSIVDEVTMNPETEHKKHYSPYYTVPSIDYPPDYIPHSQRKPVTDPTGAGTNSINPDL